MYRVLEVLERIPGACSELDKEIDIVPTGDRPSNSERIITVELPFVIDAVCTGNDAEVVKIAGTMAVSLAATDRGGEIWYEVERILDPPMPSGSVFTATMYTPLNRLTLKNLLILHWLEKEANVLSRLIRTAEKLEKEVKEYVEDLALVNAVIRLLVKG